MNMNQNKNLVTLLQEGINTVKVEFTTDGARYTYKTNLDLEVGDAVVVKVKNTGKLKVVRVVQVDLDVDISQFEDFQIRWIVQKVDMDMYTQLCNRDKDMDKLISKLEVSEKRKELTALLKENLGKAGIKLLNSINVKILPNSNK